MENWKKICGADRNATPRESPKALVIKRPPHNPLPQPPVSAAFNISTNSYIVTTVIKHLDLIYHAF